MAQPIAQNGSATPSEPDLPAIAAAFLVTFDNRKGSVGRIAKHTTMTNGFTGTRLPGSDLSTMVGAFQGTLVLGLTEIQ